ncbi:MAG: DUF2190 family protein [Geminicoccaceae bacterium]
MSYATELTKSFVAGGAITKRRIVKLGSNDGEVLQASAATDLLVGVSTEVDAASGARCDVHLGGIVEVEAGASITRGTKVTADANGKAVAAAPSAGTNNEIIGIAMVTAASGDIIPVLLAQSTKQG